MLLEVLEMGGAFEGSAGYLFKNTQQTLQRRQSVTAKPSHSGLQLPTCDHIAAQVGRVCFLSRSLWRLQGSRHAAGGTAASGSAQHEAREPLSCTR